MKTLMAIIQALLTFIGVAFIGLVFYSELSNPYNYISVSILLIIAIYLSSRVFRMISRRGYITTMTGDNASYELDNLKPVPGSGVTELTSDMLVKHFEQQSINFSQYSIEIWGDTNAPRLKEKRNISEIQFDKNLKTLKISFDDNSELHIKNPRMIHHSISYLKIIKAQEVVWRIKENSQVLEFHYTNNGSKIVTDSNTNWRPKHDDLGIGMNAIYLQG
ncbi:hypothetical protein ACPX19_08025 [Winogradskyella sp. HB-48]|uniref:hypothetical protein n=1 Tax=Winogradskyella sp. HB-48 TaxID=3416808 RepID=UPI003CF2C8F9